MKDDETPIGEETIRALKENKPPQDLEQKVVAALKANGLIRTRAIRTIHYFWKSGIAAILLFSLFGAGFMMGERSGQKTATTTGKPVFALFLYEPEKGLPGDANHVREYVRWVRSVRSRGHMASGEKLKEDGRRMEIRNGKLEIESQPAQNRPLVIAGYFLIQAKDYQEALKIASDCPHLKYGGVIEIRQIDAT